MLNRKTVKQLKQEIADLNTQRDILLEDGDGVVVNLCNVHTLNIQIQKRESMIKDIKDMLIKQERLLEYDIQLTKDKIDLLTESVIVGDNSKENQRLIKLRN